MKLTTLLSFYILPLNLLLCAGFCCNEDEDFTNHISIENNSIVSIENNANTFTIDDTIYIEAVIENVQITTDNQNVILSDYFYLDLPETVVLGHNLNLFKDSGFGSKIAIPIDEEFIEIIEGNVITDTDSNFPNLAITSVFNGTHFKSKFGIQLKEIGTFYLSKSQIGNNTIPLVIFGGDYNKGLIEINTKIVNSDPDGFYKFIVN